MARNRQISVRLTDSEWSIIQDWIRHQVTDPQMPITAAAAVRQAIRDLATNEKDRARKRKRGS